MPDIQVLTDYPVALDSPDHLHPHGTLRDNSYSRAFNHKLAELIPAPVSVLDLGCSGGGMVRTLLQEGHFAIGIEGSDRSKEMKRAEWGEIPDFLFTADITHPFTVVRGDGERVLFKVITLWEVIEHIAPDRLFAVFENIDRHLCNGGLVMMSISPLREVIDDIALHQTVWPREDWESFLTAMGWRLRRDIVNYFDPAWVRGGHNAPHSFHVVLERSWNE